MGKETIRKANKTFLSEGILNIYKALSDEESRELFKERIIMSFAEGDIFHNAFMNMMEIALRFDIDREPRIRVDLDGRVTIADFIQNNKKTKKQMVLFGAGYSFSCILPLLKRFDIEVVACIDNDLKKQETEIEGIRIISPKELFSNKSYKDLFVGISNWFNSWEIMYQLISLGLPKNRIVQFISKELQYFGFEGLTPLKKEVYLDVGCYNIGTIRDFIRFSNYKYEKIYGMEADLKNYKNMELQQSKERIKNLVLINKGAWYEDAMLSFDSNTIGSISAVVTTGNKKIHATTIDSIVKEDKITLIKMDIEGSELEALYGAEETIKRMKPRLAISIYHKPSDIIDILSYINRLVPSYKFYIRQYSYFGGETVLYAIHK